MRRGRLFALRSGILITLDNKTSSMTLLHILLILKCRYRTTRYGFRLHNRRSSESREFIGRLYGKLKIALRIARFSAITCTSERRISVRVTTHRVHCS